MNVTLARSFLKDLRKRKVQQLAQFKERRDIFMKDPFHPILNNHKLHGAYAGHRSINITGDMRAIYYERGKTAVFIRIGTHSELYEE